MSKLNIPFINYRQNKNLIRHRILGELLIYPVANNLLLHSYVSYKEIEQLGRNHLKRRFAINYLVAKGDIQNLEAGVVKNIKLTDQGEKSFYSEHYKEIGDKQIATFWRNALTLVLSIVVTVAAVIALDDNYKEELKSIPKLQKKLDSIEQQLDSIKNLMSPLHVVLDSSLNK